MEQTRLLCRVCSIVCLHPHRHRGLQLAVADVSEPFAWQASGASFFLTPNFTRFYVAGDTLSPEGQRGHLLELFQ